VNALGELTACVNDHKVDALLKSPLNQTGLVQGVVALMSRLADRGDLRYLNCIPLINTIANISNAAHKMNYTSPFVTGAGRESCGSTYGRLVDSDEYRKELQLLTLTL